MSIPVTLAESYIWRAGADQIRACLFCVHSNAAEMPAERRCHHTSVSGAANRTIDCTTARQTFGACGVEARYLLLKGEKK